LTIFYNSTQSSAIKPQVSAPDRGARQKPHPQLPTPSSITIPEVKHVWSA